MVEEFIYVLKNGFKYAKDGEMAVAREVRVSAPSNKVLRQVNIIEQEFEKSQLRLLTSFKDAIGEKAFEKLLEDKGPGATADESQKKTTPEEAVKNFYSGDADLEKCYAALKDILCSGNEANPTAVIDGITKFTRPLFDEMTPSDTKGILGGYVVNFIIASQSNSKK